MDREEEKIDRELEEFGKKDNWESCCKAERFGRK